MTFRTKHFKRSLVGLVAAGSLALAGVLAATVGTSSTGPAGTILDSAGGAGPMASSSWGPAQAIPGTAALAGPDGLARVLSLSCASPGNCVAGGEYATKPSSADYVYHGFIASQVNGTWGTAQQVPGEATLDKSGQGGVTVVSCSSPGNCSAGGTYGLPNSGAASRASAYVVSEVNGTWGQAKPVAGLAALNTGEDASIDQMSCASAGNCTAGGSYHLSTKDCCSAQGFVVSQVHGTWGKVQQVPGLAALNVDRDASVASVSCTEAGDCAAGGDYLNGHGTFQGYVADQKNGVWGKAREVPGLAALNKGGKGSGGAATDAVSCASPGNCAAGGGYSLANDKAEAFVASEHNGTWGKAAEARGASAIKPDGQATVDSVSCASPGNCAAVGHAFQVTSTGEDQNTYTTAFVVNEVKGTWGKAVKVAGLSTLNTGNDAELQTVDCPSAGNCVAGGFYTTANGRQLALVISEVNGTWSASQPIGGLAALTGTSGRSGVSTVSCAAPGKCSIGGYYLAPGTPVLPFVASRS